MKTILATMMFALVFFANVGAVSATPVCYSNCLLGGGFSPPPGVHNPTPQPLPMQPSTFNIKGTGFHNGAGNASGHGDQTFGEVRLEGGTYINSTIQAQGNLCPGNVCTQGSFSIKGSSWQNSETAAGAFSSGGRNASASAFNSGVANTGLGFSK